MPPEKYDLKGQIQASYEVSQVHEISVDWNGWNFLVIFGKHVNGWFVSIPNWRVSTELSDPSDIYYNKNKLSVLFNDVNKGIVIAEKIKEYWEENHK